MPYCLRYHSLLLLFALCLTTVFAAASVQSEPSLEQGYRDMYNLDFDHAHQVFNQWQQITPDDPLGPVSHAAAYLFSEFDRLHILELELFIDNSRFQSRSRPAADVTARQAFNAEIARGQQLISAALAKNPQDRNALFANVLLLGLQGDYVAMIEKRDLRGLSYIKQGRAVAERLLAIDPSCYDAYLAVGVENYLLSLKPAPVRWILQLGGAQADKATGIDRLRLVADKGHYLMPYARLLLAVAALRDHDQGRARDLLEGLAREFPHNHLYTQELARLTHP